MYKKYRVELPAAQRAELQTLIRTGSLSNRVHLHARVLLKADTAPGAPAWTDEQISDTFDLSVRSIVRIRQAFCQAGLARALHGQPRRPPRRTLVDGTVEAHLVALACSPPPDDRVRWTVRLLGAHLVELHVVDQISHETVRQTLKKMNLSLG
jgi:hypothetical protein